ncbi:Protein accumulation and replication of chloroplast 3 [Vitis vinifera]|uniref:Protein accumulation and replication of chloroplast 3 n=1 Tax=Vitis vinifera TaxID=29760 RepID=A0A438JRP4_VITVI|nr:Protein accumulation and replication of chloroplast 3 [Vitis vinifera]
MQTGIPMDGIADDMDMYSEELQMLLGRNDHEINASRDSNGRYEQSELGCSEATIDSLNFNDQNTEGISAFQREPLIGWNLGPGDQIAQEWAKERAADSGATTTLDNLSIFHLPVGVRPLEELNDSPNISNTTQHPETKIGDEIKAQPLVTSRMPWDELTGAGFEAVMDLYNSASTVLKGKYADIPKKQGMLSVRAASMLPSPIYPQPVDEISPHLSIRHPTEDLDISIPAFSFQNLGILSQIQRRNLPGALPRGLPEGKGRLSLRDGSIYDGMWRYGKRSGPGTLYFCNGMCSKDHGGTTLCMERVGFIFTVEIGGLQTFGRERQMVKGASIQSLVMSSLAILKMDGDMATSCVSMLMEKRCVEVWDEGVLVSREQLDSDTGTG